MGKFKNQNGEVILDLDKYVMGKSVAFYATSDLMYCYIDFEKEIDNMLISIMGRAGTPRDQINNYYVEYPYEGNPKRACVFIKGGGFVQGHIIQINYLAELKD
ncbi:MAG: hypothetical protein ACLUTN_10990 [Thomasclavelia ramosa]